MNENRFISKKSLAITVVLVFLLFVCTGLAGYFVYDHFYKDKGALLSLESYGGNCGDKQCQPMNIIVYKTGEVHHYQVPNIRQLDAASLQDLKDTIMRSDFEQLHKFAGPGRCENYADGTDYIIRFYSNGTTQTFNTCGHSLPDSKLKTVLESLQKSDYKKTTN